MFEFIQKKKKEFEARNSRAGFLIIELIVAIFIFGIVMTMSIGSLLTALDANKKAQAIKSVLNNLEIAMDTLTKTMAAGRYYHCAEGAEDAGSDYVFSNAQSPGWCDSVDVDGHTAISFVSNEELDGDEDTEDALVYRFTEVDGDGFLERKRFGRVCTTDIPPVCGPWSETDEDWVRMTAPEVNITDLRFYITGIERIEESDFRQPKVMIVVKGQVDSGPGTGLTDFAVQTVVTQLIPDF